MRMKLAVFSPFLAASINAVNAEVFNTNSTRLLRTPYRTKTRIVFCDGDGILYSCEHFSSGAMEDFMNSFGSRSTISYYSHYLDGKFNWFAVLQYKFPEGDGECMMADVACDCGAQLDRWFQIPSDYTGALVPGGRSSDYVVSWRNDGQHSEDRNDFNRIQRSCNH